MSGRVECYVRLTIGSQLDTLMHEQTHLALHSCVLSLPRCTFNLTLDDIFGLLATRKATQVVC